MKKKLLNKTEIRDLAKHGYKLKKTEYEDVRGLIVSGLVVVSHGSKDLHDSGYPFIKIFGIVDGNLYFLGWHDHFISYVPTNTDSLGKNIFHIMPWTSEKKWRVEENFISCSTFQIGNYEGEKEEFVWLS